ncbi:hypothetical protein AAL_00789 [Moelleriella libera RCEF 2490]|uniref:Uncharacterized protein n=1 Tax=Moelleriella libera RCEF 2490 TaxID=1081109 RepID=A0A166V6L0_9HYPO|nr:hypothetical protein AAL_00789 [Moelleriella libera RCEF 2490]
MKAVQILTAPVLILSSLGLTAASTVNNRAAAPETRFGRRAVSHDFVVKRDDAAPASGLASRWGDLLVSLSGVDQSKVQAARSAIVDSLKTTQSKVQSGQSDINGLFSDTIAAAGKAASSVDANSYVKSGVDSFRSYVGAQDVNAAAKNVLSYTSTLANEKRSLADPVKAVATLFSRGTFDYKTLVSSFNEGLSSLIQSGNLNSVAQSAAQAVETGVMGINWNEWIGKAVTWGVKQLGNVNWGSVISGGISLLLKYI